MAADRTVFHVTPADNQWQITKDGELFLTVQTKQAAVDEARVQARQAQPSQVVIHTADGEVEDEATYQADPFPPRG